MNNWGCFGVLVGGLVGLLLVTMFLILLQPVTPLVAIPQDTVPADVTLFLSERSLSRAASMALATPTVIDCEPGGQVQVTTRVQFGGLEPVVDLGLTLDQQGGRVVSQLHWAQLAFIKIPADWLPAEIAAAGAVPGQTITRQIPPRFTLSRLTTTTTGLNIDLTWTGQ